jgi:hypothetical protein
MTEPPVVISERTASFLDEAGYIVYIPYLVAEIDAKEELGCIVAYAIELSDEPCDWPERRELMERLVRHGCLRELELARERAA